MNPSLMSDESYWLEQANKRTSGMPLSSYKAGYNQRLVNLSF
jgi:hypothetical protein